MTTRPGRIATITGALVLAASGAQAVTLSSVNDNGNVVSTAFSTPTLIAVDVGFNSILPAELTFALEAADVGASVAFNSILSELTGRGFPGLRLWLSPGAAFVPGDVSAVDGSTPAVTLGAAGASVAIATRSAAGEVYLGDALFLGATDWRIGFSGLAAGDTFRLTISPVSSPAPLALVLAGLGLAALARRR